MSNVECPWCDGPAIVERDGHGDVVCDACAIRVEIAADPIIAAELAPAA
jgi:hypothetical protein